ncbi:UNVERIFIED_CONTAM: hypothetical protein PYX00_004335 [Menopon gallinae]|uniref:Ig-like domain-containing protein n=1 Tax=Menopon gallinae TaxID=328185 RepID=A0AAW2I597_9NEOP
MQPHVFGTLLTTVILAITNSRTYGKLITKTYDQDDNGIVSAPPARITNVRTKDWIKISQEPPQIVTTRFGERVEIECEVLGSPTPEIQWLRGNQVVQQTERINTNIHSTLPDAYHDKAGLAKIRSRLVINCITSKHEGLYVCSAKAGVETVQSKPTLILIQGGKKDSCEDAERNALQKPRIVTWNPTAMENIGVDVLLPCEAEGNPPPKVSWVDQDNKSVEDYRFQTLSNGDLAIYRLSWEDMGEYTCVAENSAGSDAVTTFIYPVLNKD